MAKITSELLISLLFCMVLRTSEQRSTSRGRRGVSCRKEFMDRGNVARLGYCWKFNPNRIRRVDAEAACEKLGGHLVTVDSREKADALAKFIQDSWLLTNEGYFGKTLASYYRHQYGRRGFAGMPYTIISGVRTTSNGGRTQWTATGGDVQWGAYGDRQTKRHTPGTHCTFFSHQAKMWIFTRLCKTGYKSVCEQGSGSSSSISSNSKPISVPRPKPRPAPRPRPTARRTTTTTTTTTPRPTTTQQALDPSEYYYYDDDYYYYYY